MIIALASGDALPPDIIRFRSSTKAFLFKSGFGWLLITATVATFGMAAIITLPLLGIMHPVNVTSTYELQQDRLRMQRGIILRAEKEIELFRVKDIRASYSFIQQLFGSGNLELISSDATGKGPGRRKDFIISNVEGARAIREELRTRIDAARRRKGVRELDLA